MTDMITQQELKELLSYNSKTGIFTWLVSLSNRVKIGGVAGSPDSNGYSVIKVRGRRYYAHRLAWLYMTGARPKSIDHINHDRADNRIINLREATQQENMRNSTLRKDNTSGVCGVYQRKDMNKWQALIVAEGKILHLGYFTDKFEAICARKSAGNKYGYHANHGS